MSDSPTTIFSTRFCDDAGMVSHERHPRFDGSYLDFCNHLRRLSGHDDPVIEEFACTGSMTSHALGETVVCSSPFHKPTDDEDRIAERQYFQDTVIEPLERARAHLRWLQITRRTILAGFAYEGVKGVLYICYEIRAQITRGER